MTENQTPLTYSDWLQHLAKGQMASCYFFFGPEEVLIGRALEKLKEVVLEPGTADFNWDLYRAGADDMNWAAYADALTSLPLLAARRLVVLKQAGRAQQNKAVANLIERAVVNPPSDLTLVFIEEEPDLRKAFFKKLTDHCVSVAFLFARPIELQRYLKEYVAGFGKEITEDALERILVDSSPGLRELFSKLEVLVFFTGDKKAIEAEDVEACSAFSREVEIYHLLDALGRRDGAEARTTLERLLQRRADVGALIYSLQRQIWALYRMKYLQEKKVPVAEWQAQLDLKPPFLAKRYREYLPHFQRRELGRSLEILAQADRARKTAAVSDPMLSWMLIEKLLNPLSLRTN